MYLMSVPLINFDEVQDISAMQYQVIRKVTIDDNPRAVSPPIA
jgi:hypothetical protein